MPEDTESAFSTGTHPSTWEANELVVVDESTTWGLVRDGICWVMLQPMPPGQPVGWRYVAHIPPALHEALRGLPSAAEKVSASGGD